VPQPAASPLLGAFAWKGRLAVERGRVLERSVRVGELADALDRAKGLTRRAVERAPLQEPLGWLLAAALEQPRFAVAAVERHIQARANPPGLVRVAGRELIGCHGRSSGYAAMMVGSSRIRRSRSVRLAAAQAATSSSCVKTTTWWSLLTSRSTSRTARVRVASDCTVTSSRISGAALSVMQRCSARATRRSR